MSPRIQETLCRRSIYYEETRETLIWKSRWLDQAVQTLIQQEPQVLGWLYPEESRMLLRLACYLPENSTVVELGSFCGKSTRWLAVGCAFSGSSLTCFDTFASSSDGVPGADQEAPYGSPHDLYNHLRESGGTLPLFRNHLMHALPPDIARRVVCHKMTTEEAAGYWRSRSGSDFADCIGGYLPKPIDLLFIDADHSRCQQDVDIWLPHLADHGMICLHDSTQGNAIYGDDGPPQTKLRLLQTGQWRQYDFKDLTSALTRDPGWWATRAEVFQDHNYRPAKKRE